MQVVVGTAGHIDHGKTSIVKALTGTDTDGLIEEKKRGLAAKQRVAELLDTATEVQLISHGVGKFGRCLGEIDFCCPDSLTMKNLNNTLIEEGHAVEYHGGKR